MNDLERLNEDNDITKVLDDGGESSGVPFAKWLPFDFLLDFPYLLSQYPHELKDKHNFTHMHNDYISSTKEDMVYTSLSPEILSHINPKNLKHFLHSMTFYKEFNSENFCLTQMSRSQYIAELDVKDRLPCSKTKTLPNIIEALSLQHQVNSNCEDIFTLLSEAIALFFTEQNENVLLQHLAKLIEKFGKYRESLSQITFEIICAIEDNFIILINLIELRFPQFKVKFYYLLVKVLNTFKSKKLIMKLISVTNDIQLDEGECLEMSYLTKENIVDFKNVFSENEFNDSEFKTNLKFKAFIQRIYPLFSNVSVVTVAYSNDEIIFLLYESVLNILVYFKCSKELSWVDTNILNFPFKQPNKMNMFVKGNLLYIYDYINNNSNNSSSNSKSNEFVIQVYDIKSLQLIHMKTFTFDNEVKQVLFDNKYIYVFLSNNTVNVVKIQIEFNKTYLYTYNNSNNDNSSNIVDITNFTMLSSFSIGDMFYTVDTTTNYIYLMKCNIDHHNKCICIYNNKLSIKNKPEYKLIIKGNRGYVLHLPHNIETIKIRNIKLWSDTFYLKYKDHSFNFSTLPQKSNESLSSTLLYNYVKYISLYGNFLKNKRNSPFASVFRSSPQLFAFNNNILNINYILQELTNPNIDKQKTRFACFLFLLEQSLNCLYNMNKLNGSDNIYKDKIDFKSISAFIMKHIEMYTHKKYEKNSYSILYLIGNVVEYLRDVVDVDVSEDMIRKMILNDTYDIKEKLLFVRLLYKKLGMNSNMKIFLELEMEIFSLKNIAYVKKHYTFIYSVFKEIFNYMYCNFDIQHLNDYCSLLLNAGISLANQFHLLQSELLSKDNSSLNFIQTLIRQSPIIKVLVIFIQVINYKQDKNFLKQHLVDMFKLIIAFDKVSIFVEDNDNIDKDDIYEIETCSPETDEVKRSVVVKLPNECNSVYIKPSMWNNDKIDNSSSNSSKDSNNTSSTVKVALQNGKNINVSMYCSSKYTKTNQLTFHFYENKNASNTCRKYQIIPIKHITEQTQVFVLDSKGSNVYDKDIIGIIEKGLIYYILTTSHTKDKVKDNNNNNNDNDNNSNERANAINSEIYTSKILQYISLDKATPSSTNENAFSCNDIITQLNIPSSKSKITNLFSQYSFTTTSSKSTYSDINFTIEPYKHLISSLNKALSIKSAFLSKLGGDMLLPLVTKLFSIIIKYYNLNSKLEQLSYDIKDETENFTKIQNFDLFFNIWNECSKIRTMFNEQKSVLGDTTSNENDLDKEVSKYLTSLHDKSNFIYSIILPQQSGSSKIEISLVSKLIDLLKNKNFSIDNISKFSQSQNDKCMVKYYQISLVNLLLALITKEHNVNLVLYHLNKNFRTESKKIVSFIDDLLGADYIATEKITNQFHLLLHILQNKISDTSYFDKLTVTTKINIYQSLIWKIKGRDFNALTALTNLFKPLLHINNTSTTRVNKDSLIQFGYKRFNNETVMNKLFDLFKVFTLQVFNKIKCILIKDNANVNKNGNLSLLKETSKINEDDYNDIITFILNFYMDIQYNNYYFEETLFLLYKCLVNQFELIELCVTRKPEFLSKTVAIANDAKMNLTTRLIALRIVRQCLMIICEYDLKYQMKVVFSENDVSNSNSNSDDNEVNVNVIFRKFVNLIKEESSNVLKDEYVKIVLMISKYINNASDEIKQINNEDLIHIMVPLLGVKLNYLKNDFPIEIINNTNDKRKFEDDSLFMVKSSFANDTQSKPGHIISFINNNPTSSLFQIDNNNKSTYINTSNYNVTYNQTPSTTHALCILDENLSSQSSLSFTQVPLSSLSINLKLIKPEQTLFNKGTSTNNNNKSFIETHGSIISQNIITYIKQIKYQKYIYLLLKLLYKLIDYVSIETEKEIMKAIAPFLLKDPSKIMFCSLESLEYKLSQTAIDNSYLHQFKKEFEFSKHNKKENINEIHELFTYEIEFSSYLKMMSKNGNILIKGTLAKPNCIPNVELYAEHSEFIIETEEPSDHKYKYDFTKKLNESTVLFIWSVFNDNTLIDYINNEPNIKFIVTNSSCVYRELVKKPLFIINKHKLNEIFSFLLYANQRNFNREFTLSNENSIFSEFIDENHLHFLYQSFDLLSEQESFTLSDLFGESQYDPQIEKEMESKFNNAITDIKTKIINSLDSFDLFNRKVAKRIYISILKKNRLTLNDLDIIINDKTYGKKCTPFLIHLNLIYEYYYNFSNSSFNQSEIKYLVTNYIHSIRNALSDNNNNSNISSSSNNNNELAKMFLKDYITYYENVYIDLSMTYEMYLKMMTNKNILKQDKAKHLPTEDFIWGCIEDKNFDIVHESILVLYTFNIPLSSLPVNTVFSFLKGCFSFFCNDAFKKHIADYVFKLLTELYNIILNKRTNYKLYIEFIEKYRTLDELVKLYIRECTIERINDPKFTPDNVFMVSLQIISKYFDIAFYLMFNYGIKYIVVEILENNYNVFHFYLKYLLLAINNNYDDKDFKEKIVTVLFSLKTYAFVNTQLNSDEHNKIKELIIKEGTSENNIIPCDNKHFKLHNIDNTNNTSSPKLVFYIHDEQTNKSYLQDIVDYSRAYDYQQNFIKQSPTQSLRVIARKHIPTHLYAFGSNISNCLGIDQTIGNDYKQPTQCVGLSNYTWSFGFGYLYCVCIDDEEGTVYSCGANCGAGLKKVSVSTFTKDNRIQNSNIGFKEIACGNANATLLLGKDDKLYGIGMNNENVVFGTNSGKKLKTPTLIMQIPNQEKVKHLALGYDNAFVISENGNGYVLGGNNERQLSLEKGNPSLEWVQVPLPVNCKRYVKVAIGEHFFLFIIETIHNKHLLYSLGNNAFGCCCLDSSITSNPTAPTQCHFLSDIEFKHIATRNTSSAAITTDGHLYIFGRNPINSDATHPGVVYPTLINFGPNAIVDDVAVSTFHILCIVRTLRNGVYVRELYSGGKKNHGVLGETVKSNKIMNKVKLFSSEDDNDSNNIIQDRIPIKVCVGANQSFVLCVNGNDICASQSDVSCKVGYTSKSYEYIADRLIEKYNDTQMIETFINYLRGCSHKHFQSFLDWNEVYLGMEISKSTSTLDNLIEFFKSSNQFNDLHTLYTDEKYGNAQQNSISLQMLFAYMKEKLTLIENELLSLSKLNQKLTDKAFLQRAISDNLNLISSKVRIDMYLKELSKLKRYSSTYIQIEVDRFEVSEFYLKKTEDVELNHTVFAKVFHGTSKLQNEKYFLHKGQKLCEIKLKGERAIDQGGPFYESISQMCMEIESGYLDLFIKTPNNKNDVGLYREAFIPNPSASLNLKRNAFMFLGKLMASALGSGTNLNLNLHPIVWRFILGNEIMFNDIETIDYLFYKQISDLTDIAKDAKSDVIDSLEINFVCVLSNGKEIELKPNGKNIFVNINNINEYIDLIKQMRINECKQQLEWIQKGFYDVVPAKIVQILIWRQLEEFVCGNRTIDIEMLKKHTEYSEYSANDTVVQWFWEWLSSLDEKGKSMYIKFTWGRTRLPRLETTNINHKISKHHVQNAYPHSSTCFFSLKLPIYTSKEILYEKMTYAIMNCNEIDGD